MDNYNVVVLMIRDNSTGILSEVIDSYIIEAGISYIEKIYLENENDEYYIYLALTTKDVEDWEYYGIYDLYDEDIFKDHDIEVLDGSGDYNPKWILKFKYNEDRKLTELLINSILSAHINELDRIMPLVNTYKEKYIKEANSME